MSGECAVFLVLSHCSKNLKQRMDQCYSSVLQLSYSSVLFGKQRKIHPQSVRADLRAGPPKRSTEKRREARGSILDPFFNVIFLLPQSLPSVNWASQEGCLLHLRFLLRSSDLPLTYFHGLFPFFVF